MATTTTVAVAGRYADDANNDKWFVPGRSVDAARARRPRAIIYRAADLPRPRPPPPPDPFDPISGRMYVRPAGVDAMSPRCLTPAGPAAVRRCSRLFIRTCNIRPRGWVDNVKDWTGMTLTVT